MIKEIQEWIDIFCREHDFKIIAPSDKENGVYITGVEFPVSNENCIFRIDIREEKYMSDKGFYTRDWKIIKTNNCIYYAKDNCYQYYGYYL